MTHVAEQLEHVGGRILGGVLNDFDTSRAKGYAPTYGYSRYEEPAGDGTGRLRRGARSTGAWSESAPVEETRGNGSRSRRPLRAKP